MGARWGLDDRLIRDARWASHEDLPLWCGRCHPHTRALAVDLDRPEPCPTCHPRTRRAATRPTSTAALAADVLPTSARRRPPDARRPTPREVDHP